MDKKNKPDSYHEYTAADARAYHQWYLEPPGSDIVREQQQALLAAAGDGGGRKLLDIGCGTGIFCSCFNSAGFSVTGIDNSPEMIALAEKKYGGPVSFRPGDATHLPFPDRSFDVAVFATSFEFVGDARTALSEAARVARGKIVFLLLNPDHEMNAGRMRKAAEHGGVFSAAKLRPPAEMKRLIHECAGSDFSITVHGHSTGSPYYILAACRGVV